MKREQSTFDQLVKSLSTEETQQMLSSIRSGISNVINESEQSLKTDVRVIKLKKPADFEKESFFVKLLLAIKSFFKSVPIEVLYTDELIKRMGRSLKYIAKDYVNIGKGFYTNIFYERLRKLHIAQMLFSTLLATYNSSKGHFYMLLSSFCAPNCYEKLIRETNPFSIKPDSEVSSNIRTGFLRKIDAVFSIMTDEEKSEMYKSAQAVEWMKAFCDIQIDKMLLRFSSMENEEMVCQAITIRSEIELLAGILSSKKEINNNLLQALFLMQSEGNICDDKINKNDIEQFINNATEAIGNVTSFFKKIPLIDIVAYFKKDIDWVPNRVDGGEDWFIYFKQAWYERFNKNWSEWSYEQRKVNLTTQIIELLQIDSLESLNFSPWDNLWIDCTFKKEFLFLFYKSLFNSFYKEKILPTLKIILLNGSFYRNENLSEFTSSYNLLERRKFDFENYEKRLSPNGDIGISFSRIREEKTATLKNKNQIEALMRSVELEAKQLIDTTVEAFKSIETVLVGIIGGKRTSIYASLTNWASILGSQTSKFHADVNEVRKQIHLILDLNSMVEKLEIEIH